MTLEHFRLLEFEIKVRMALLEDNVDKAIRMCTNRIHLFPSEIGPRKLLAKILLRNFLALSMVAYFDQLNVQLNGMIRGENPNEARSK